MHIGPVERKDRGIAETAWLITAAVIILSAFAGVFAVFRAGRFAPEAALVKESVRDVFQSQENGRVFEVDLDENSAPRQKSSAEAIGSRTSPPEIKKSKDAENQNSGGVIASKSPREPSASVPSKKAAASANTSAVSSQTPLRCNFGMGAAPSRKLAFNEIAWMGTSRSPDNEWIEIINTTARPYDASGVRLMSESGKISVSFPSGAIAANGFYLLERTDDDTVPGISADAIYTGSLSNAGERLKLFGANCELLDEINALSGWSNFGGDNATKQTAERNVADLAWHTSRDADGTPRAANSDPPPPPPQTGGAQTPPAPQPPQSQTPPPAPAPTSTPPAPPPSVPSGIPYISEILAGIDGNANYEFVELYNPTDQPIDLTGWSIKKKSSTGSESSLLVASRLSGKVIPPRSYFLAANEGGYAGTAAPDVSWATSNTLAYTNNAIILYDAAGVKAEEVSWTEIPKDQSYARDIASGSFSLSTTPSPQNTQGGS